MSKVLENFGEEIKAVKKNIGEKVSNIENDQDLKGFIKQELKSCIEADNLRKALATVDYCLHSGAISSKELTFLTDSDLYGGHDHFETEFLGLCRSLHYINDTE